MQLIHLLEPPEAHWSDGHSVTVQHHHVRMSFVFTVNVPGDMHCHSSRVHAINSHDESRDDSRQPLEDDTPFGRAQLLALQIDGKIDWLRCGVGDTVVPKQDAPHRHCPGLDTADNHRGLTHGACTDAAAQATVCMQLHENRKGGQPERQPVHCLRIVYMRRSRRGLTWSCQ